MIDVVVEPHAAGGTQSGAILAAQDLGRQRQHHRIARPSGQIQLVVVQVVAHQLVVLDGLAVTFVLVVFGGIDRDRHSRRFQAALTRPGQIAAEPQPHVQAVGARLQPQMRVDHRLGGGILEPTQHHRVALDRHGHLPGLTRFQAIAPQVERSHRRHATAYG